MVRIAFHYLGCRLNEAENEALARAFIDAGHCIVSLDESPDVIVLNTCGVTSEAMRKSRNLARRMVSHRPRILVLTGCAIDLMTRGENPLYDDELQALYGETPDSADRLEIIRILCKDKPHAAEIILRAVDRRFSDNSFGNLQPRSTYRLRMRSFIKIQDGCNNRCSYCSVRIARGCERSESTESILREIRRCLELGEHEFVLTGVQLGAWNEGPKRKLPQLIADILAQTDVRRLRLSSIEPWHMRPELWELWQDTRLCPHFHIPVQSGSDDVLTAMRRRTPLGIYLEKLDKIRTFLPKVRISTDIIVGFPGETDDMWQETMDFLNRAEFDDVHLFRFSARPGTDAASLPNPVAPDIKRRRWNEAEERIQAIRRRRMENAVGSECRVLWETSDAPSAGKVRWYGYSENYLRLSRVFDESTAMRGAVTEEKFSTDDIELNFGG